VSPPWALRGKTCLVTGATSGIGKETALALARQGATVVLTCRTLERGRAAQREIRVASENPSVEVLVGDHTSLKAVRAMADDFLARHDRLHVLVNNAGGVFGPRRLTEDAFEYNLQINHLAHFLLTNLLLDRLQESAPSRIITVSSGAHRWGRLEFEDLQMERGFTAMGAYGRSKLANILFTRELARRLAGTGVTANALHPGVVGTGFGSSATGPVRWGFRWFGWAMLSPARGADTSIFLASSPEVAGITGEYFSKRRVRSPSPEARDDAAARRLWEVSARLCGIGAD